MPRPLKLGRILTQDDKRQIHFINLDEKRELFMVAKSRLFFISADRGLSERAANTIIEAIEDGKFDGFVGRIAKACFMRRDYIKREPGIRVVTPTEDESQPSYDELVEAKNQIRRLLGEFVEDESSHFKTPGGGSYPRQAVTFNTSQGNSLNIIGGGGGGGGNGNAFQMPITPPTPEVVRPVMPTPPKRGVGPKPPRFSTKNNGK